MKRRAVQSSWLDRAISAVSPSWGLKRAVAKTRLGLVNQAPDRVGGGSRGGLSNWNPRQVSGFEATRQREAIGDRAEDLVANNIIANTAVHAMATNVVGEGLIPHVELDPDVLKISEGKAEEIGLAIERGWRAWTQEADAAGRMTFSEHLYLAVLNLMTYGEFAKRPVMMPDSPQRRYSLALQDIHPRRICTPNKLASSQEVIDGVRLGPGGKPTGYYIADPKGVATYRTLTSADYKYFPAWTGHRPGLFHYFRAVNSEQVRGISPLAPGMKTWRDFDDYMEYELVAALTASSFPVIFEHSATPGISEGLSQSENPQDGVEEYDMELRPGGIYGGDGKPHFPQPNRPGNSYHPTVQLYQRQLTALTGQCLEMVLRDFSDTNYSGHRGAEKEVWRGYMTLRGSLVSHTAQPTLEMVAEEMYLRGDLKLPKGAAGFYDERKAWTRATWTGPAKGYLDPLNETQAQILALAARLGTRADIFGELNKDWRDQFRQMGKEERALLAEGIVATLTTKPSSLINNDGEAADD